MLWITVLMHIAFAGALKSANPEDLRVLQCLAIYQFDFVAEELGLSVAVEGDDAPADDTVLAEKRAEQIARFLETEKLELRPQALAAKIKPSRDIAQRCQILAESVMEILLYKEHLRQQNEKSRPAPLDQFRQNL